MELNSEFYENASKKFNSDEKNKLARNAVTATKLEDIVVNRDLIQTHNRIFSNYNTPLKSKKVG